MDSPYSHSLRSRESRRVLLSVLSESRELVHKHDPVDNQIACLLVFMYYIRLFPIRIMDRYHHLMYASTNHISQLFSEQFGDLSQLDIESTEEVASTVEGKLGAIIGSLTGDLSGSVSTSEIRKINFDDELFQTKQVVNQLLTDSHISSVTDLYGVEHPSPEMYRFSSEVILKPVPSEFDDENYIEVIGFEANVKFRGVTSLENWGSRSHLLNAMRAEDTYPFQGILSPISRENSIVEHDVFRVQYLFICAPDAESVDKWRKRQALKQERNFLAEE